MAVLLQYLPVVAILGLYLPTPADSVPSSVRIGGIFNTPLEEQVFRFTVNFVNERNIIGQGIRLDYVVNLTNHIDTFPNIQLSCSHAERGVMAFIGPISSTSVKSMAPVSSALRVPQIAPAATNPRLGDKEQFPFLVRMMPPDSVQSHALVDLVEHYGWTRMAILTSDTDYGLNGLVEFQSEASKRGWTVISVLRFSAATPATNTDAISQLKVIRDSGARVIILNCLAVFSKEVLSQARDLDMTGSGWGWVVTDGSTGSSELTHPSTPSHLVGLIGTIPAVGGGRLYWDFAQEWAEMDAREGSKFGSLDAFSALIADAVLTFAFAARTMYEDPANDLVDIANDTVECDDDPVNSWQYGHQLLQHMVNTKEDGVAEFIEFNSLGAPLRPAFDIVNLREEGWAKVGRWTPQQKLRMSGDVTFMGGDLEVLDYVSSLANKTLTVVTIEEPPFVVLLTDRNKIDLTNLQPHDVEGYCIDLLNKLASIAGFTYTLYHVEDGSFGIKNPDTGQWNGMVNDLVMRKADMAAADLTISYGREKDIDYTMPFLDLGMTFVLKIPEILPTNPFKFLDPFTPQLWLYTIATTFVVGAIISLMNKLSPFDYHGGFVYCADDSLDKTTYAEWKTYKRRKEKTLSELNFTNAAWFAIASLLSQGGDIYPKSPSGRFVGILWWLAIVILTATYTANLAAFLTSSRIQTSINSVEDLASQTKITYGTARNSAPHQFFMDSGITLYEDMDRQMQGRDSYVPNSNDGIERTRRGNFAYVWDSAVLEYLVEQQPCDIQTVGRIFGKIGYGFGLQKNSPYKSELTGLILQLRENGYMDELQQKWYVDRGQCSDGAEKPTATEAVVSGQLDYKHLLGVFYIIYGGLCLAVVALFFEWLVICYRNVDVNDPYLSNSLSESIRKHLRLLKKDIAEDWLPRLPAIGLFKHGKSGQVTMVPPPKPTTNNVTSHFTDQGGVLFKMAKYDAPIFNPAATVSNGIPEERTDVVAGHQSNGKDNCTGPRSAMKKHSLDGGYGSAVTLW